MIPKTFLEWVWQIGFVVLFCGFGIGLAVAYAKPKLDALWGRYSEKKRLQNEQEKKEMEATAQTLISQPSEMQDFQFHRIRVLMYFYVSLAFYLVFFMAATFLLLPIPDLMPSNSPIPLITAIYQSLTTTPSMGLRITLGVFSGGSMIVFATQMIRWLRVVRYSGELHLTVRRLMDAHFEDSKAAENKRQNKRSSK